MTRALLDVNVLVSGAISPRGAPRQILILWLAERFIHVTSDGIITTVESKLLIPSINRNRDITLGDVAQYVALLRDQSDVVQSSRLHRVVVTGDPEDDGVLAAAVGGNAEFLVTGDRRLQALREHSGVLILTPREFLSLLIRRLSE